MGFWNLFKKIEKHTTKTKKISKNELKNWIEKEKEKTKERDGILFNDIKKRIFDFEKDCELRSSQIESVNLQSRSIEGRAADIVKENMKNYISHLEKFISNLKKIKIEDDIEEKINILFSDFQKKSSVNFQKMSYMGGKELINIKNIITKFLADIQKITKIYEEDIRKSRVVKFIESKNDEIDGIEKIKKDISNELEKANEKISSLNKNIKEKEKEIEKIKGSAKYVKMEKDKEYLKNKKHELSKDIEKLAVSIDFKLLAKFYHGIEKEMIKIKKYKENFKETFNQADKEELILLAKEAKLLNADEIANHIEKIYGEHDKISNTMIEEIVFNDIENEINSIKYKIDEHFIENKAKERKKKKIEEDLEKINNELRSKMSEIYVELSE